MAHVSGPTRCTVHAASVLPDEMTMERSWMEGAFAQPRHEAAEGVWDEASLGPTSRSQPIEYADPHLPLNPPRLAPVGPWTGWCGTRARLVWGLGTTRLAVVLPLSRLADQKTFSFQPKPFPTFFCRFDILTVEGVVVLVLPSHPYHCGLSTFLLSLIPAPSFCAVLSLNIPISASLRSSRGHLITRTSSDRLAPQSSKLRHSSAQTRRSPCAACPSPGATRAIRPSQPLPQQQIQ